MLGLCELVWTQDFDGEVRLRLVRRSKVPFGPYGPWVGGVSNLKTHPFILCPDGTVAGGYVKRWEAWQYNRNPVFPSPTSDEERL